MAGPIAWGKPRATRRGGAAALLLVVTALHLWLGDELLEDRLGWGASSAVLRRIEVAFVRELALAPAPTVAPVIMRPVRRAAAPKPADSASAPQPTAQAEAQAPALAAPVAALAATPAASDQRPSAAEPPSASAGTPPEVAPAAGATQAEAGTQLAAALPAAASAPEAPAFEWPPSTRLSYNLSGYYRGDVLGSASVEWIRVGLRYQVHLEALIGPSLTPLMSRRVSSEGVLGERGLSPQRFEGEQRVGFSGRRWSMQFEPDRVVLPGGVEVAAVPGVQDEASMFVQLTWLFTTQPHLLKVGRTIEVPLALPRRVELWQYDVVAEETLTTPFAQVPTVHVKPRRQARKGGDMIAEVWFAPGLQYLPVRILIHQDAQTFIDLMLERAPLQAAPR